MEWGYGPADINGLKAKPDMRGMKRFIIETIKSVLKRTDLPVGYGPSPDALYKQEASDAIRSELLSEKPSFVARFGWTELDAIIAYTKNIERNVRFGKLVKLAMKHLVDNRLLLKESSGFFTNDVESVKRFCQYQIDIMKAIDICATWIKQERFLRKYLSDVVWFSGRSLFDPYVKAPWTAALEGKRILVVSQFTKSIECQYSKREVLFDNRNYLPEFHLETYKPVQVVDGGRAEYETWWDALETMKEDISQKEFDIAILSCGAFGHPLCAFIKSMGKKAVYMGGELQLMFGVYGDRWSGNPVINEHWIRPLNVDLPGKGAANSYKALGNYI